MRSGDAQYVHGEVCLRADESRTPYAGDHLRPPRKVFASRLHPRGQAGNGKESMTPRKDGGQHRSGGVEGHARVTVPPRPVCWGARQVSPRLSALQRRADAISMGAGIKPGPLRCWQQRAFIRQDAFQRVPGRRVLPTTNSASSSTDQSSGLLPRGLRVQVLPGGPVFRGVAQR